MAEKLESGDNRMGGREVYCTGLENLEGKSPKMAEMPGFCGFKATHDARFLLRSACCDGTWVGTEKDAAFRRHIGFIQMRDIIRRDGIYAPDDRESDAVVIQFEPRPRLEPEPVTPAPDEWPDLYFIGCDNGPIKIGVSGDPVKRLRTLQTGYPYKLRLLCVVKEGCLLEPEYHARFAAHRLEGEWFERHPDILAEIERLKGEAA